MEFIPFSFKTAFVLHLLGEIGDEEEEDNMELWRKVSELVPQCTK